MFFLFFPCFIFGNLAIAIKIAIAIWIAMEISIAIAIAFSICGLIWSGKTSISKFGVTRTPNLKIEN